ncbi:MAG TPA: ATP-binding protein, partial [Longimicrobiaceae bacterium]|nr:ATP-binding protein [Longimicrobiaceae bacterium]
MSHSSPDPARRADELRESHAELEDAYEALRERDEQFALISENIREVFWIFNPDFSEAIYVSPAYEKLWGRTVESVYDDPGSFVAAIYPDDRAKLIAAMKAVRDTPFEGITYRILRPDGQVRWAWSRGYPVRDAQGEVYRVVGTTEDITEEREREEELRLLAGALEGLDEGVSVMRFDGRIVYSNSTHRRLLGYDEAGTKLPNVREVIPDEATMRQMDEAFRTVALRGAWAGRSRRQRLSDGRIIPVEMILGRVDREEGETLVFNIVRDLTEEIAREDQLRRVERLASVGTLIGGVAHELNNPLHAIRNFAELMLLEERGEEDREALEIIRREADRAAKVVSDLRIFARQTQEEQGERGEVDLNDVVRHVLKLRSYAMTTRDIEVVEELDPDLPRVWANRGEIEQVALNLIVNAEQAVLTRPCPRRITLRTQPAGKGAALLVIDNGPGIPDGQRARIFDPFFTTKAPGEGTGLGLSLVHGILQEHGGEIRVESEPGQGAAFTVTLPGVPKTARPPEVEEAARPANRRPLRILVVDDEP